MDGRGRDAGEGLGRKIAERKEEQGEQGGAYASQYLMYE